jgi:hypothetical protein
MTATEKLVKAINERMRAASQGALSGASSTANAVVNDCRQTATESDVDTTEQPSNRLPLKLSGAARVISEFHLDWPRQWPHQEKNSQQPDLVVHYVRMEQEERVSTLQGFYRRQLKNAESRYIKQGNWLESVERLTEHGRLRSVDVTITRPTDTPPRDRTAKEPLVIEILWIEAPDCTR